MKYDISKLPKWAQAEIHNLHREINRLKERIAERDKYMSAQYPKTDTYLWQGFDVPDRPLPPGAMIDFYLNGTTQKYDDSLTVRMNAGKTAIEILGAMRDIVVRPAASNHIYVANEKR